ncbi:NUDIX hydrolase [Salinispira pacifica]
MSAERDWTATTLVVHRGRVLLHAHRKLGLVLPLGGHIEPGELPDEAALREVREESGFEVELLHAPPVWPLTDVRQLARPVALLLEDISPGHQHIDLIYIATLKDQPDHPSHPPGSGTEELMWLSATEIETVEMPENVRSLARYALEIVENGSADGRRLPPGARVRPADSSNDRLIRPDEPGLA